MPALTHRMQTELITQLLYQTHPCWSTKQHFFESQAKHILYDKAMVAGRGINIVELDEAAYEHSQPFGIITADCTQPSEIDDGIAVEVLPSEQEMYRVRVFAVDTSDLYQYEETVRQVIERTESRYHNPNSGDESYEPMLNPYDVEKRHFVAPKIRDAVVISFVLGAGVPPTDETIEFGKVHVRQNMTYAKFGEKCRYSPNFAAFGRAAALILHHLAPLDVSEEHNGLHRSLIHVPREETFKRGARINSAFMVGANHIAGRIMQDEGLLGIYRVHDPTDPTFREFIDPRVAHYSTTPGPHNGLGVDVYTRVTSPLRRSEDFIMHGLLRARQQGRQLNGRDKRLVNATVQRLNQRVVNSAYNNVYNLRDKDVWVPGTS